MQSVLHTVLTPEVNELLDQFSQATGTRIVFYDAAKKLLKAGMDSPDCAYCQLLQSELYGAGRCHEMNFTGRQAHHYECHAGLHEAVIPVYSEGCLLGYAMIGQIRTRPSIPAPLLKDWQACHGNRRLSEAFRSVPLVSEERLEALISFFCLLMDYVVTKHLVFLQGNSCVVAAIEYMANHLAEPLTLPEVAAKVNRSIYSLSHAFQKHLQTTFKRVLTEMKLSKAEEMLAEDPDLTVAEVAERLGYDDPFYFSRIFRRQRGEPPSELKKRVQKLHSGETCPPQSQG